MGLYKHGSSEACRGEANQAESEGRVRLCSSDLLLLPSSIGAEATITNPNRTLLIKSSPPCVEVVVDVAVRASRGQLVLETPFRRCLLPSSLPISSLLCRRAAKAVKPFPQIEAEAEPCSSDLSHDANVLEGYCEEVSANVENDEIIAHALQEEFSRLAVA